MGIVGSAYLAALVAVWAAHDVATPATTWPRALAEAGDLLLLTAGSLHYRAQFEWLPVGVGLLGLGAMLALAWTLFRPLALPLERPGSAARRRARELVEHHGDDTLSYFKLREDKLYLFTEDGSAFLGYRVESGVLLVSGDPVGPRDARPELAAATLALARAHGLRVGVLGASEDAVGVWRAAGLRSLYIGDEAIVELARFSLEGRRIRKVRQSVHRLERAGYRIELRELGDLEPATLAELEAVAVRFLRGAPDRSFAWSMDTLRGAHQRDSVVVLARDATGAARGFLHFVPSFRRPAMSLSFMRRDRDTPNGLTEYLVASAIELLRERGIEELSLNFAAFARWMHSPVGARERAFGRLARVGSSRIQMESLYRFNAKFLPRWDPRYLVFEGRLGLLRAGLASMWIEGQAPRPHPRDARVRGDWPPACRVADDRPSLAHRLRSAALESKPVGVAQRRHEAHGPGVVTVGPDLVSAALLGLVERPVGGVEEPGEADVGAGG